MKNYFEAAEVLALNNLDEIATPQGVYRYFVLGNPIHHSRSPEMHGAALKDLEMNESYGRIRLEEADVKPVLQHLQSLGAKGVNVTIPHKFTALNACDELAESAAEFGAVNTIEFLPNGKLRGHNTDGQGFVRATEADFSLKMETLTLAVVGAGGGAGIAIAQACANAQVKRLLLANRSIEKIESLRIKISAKHPELQVEITPISELENHAWFPEIDVFVNTTSLGLKKSDPLPFNPCSLLPTQAVYDTIYNPDPTQLLQKARLAGAKTSNGRSMLAWQGALAFEIWNQKLPAIKKMYAAI